MSRWPGKDDWEKIRKAVVGVSIDPDTREVRDTQV